VTAARLVDSSEGGSSAVDRVLDRLEEVGNVFMGTRPDTWSARCPQHVGDGYMLKVSVSPSGRAVLQCESGCRTQAIALAAGIDEADVEPDVVSIFRLLTDVELEQLPPIAFLAEGKIPAGGLAAIYGPPGSGKSFLAIDLSCCIGAGVTWLSLPAMQGRVVYVAAEGSAGLRQRVGAWKAHQGITGQSLPIHFLTQPANLLTPAHVKQLLLAIEALPTEPILIVIDTMHRSMPGGDENSAKDVGLVIEHAEQIRRSTGATVLLVHHTAKGSDVERGSSSLRGAVDALLFVKVDEDRRELRCEKSKDWAPFEPVPFSLLPVGESCVVLPAESGESMGRDALTPPMRKALTILSRDFGAKGATASAWMAATEMSAASFFRARGALVGEGYVSEPPQARGGLYRATESGRSLVALNSHEALTKLSTTGTPLTLTLSEPRRGDSDESKERVGASVQTENSDGVCEECGRKGLRPGTNACAGGMHLRRRA
jgi:KaiC/GvpD/RAD55 family RecA-like ATPase